MRVRCISVYVGVFGSYMNSGVLGEWIGRGGLGVEKNWLLSQSGGKVTSMFPPLSPLICKEVSAEKPEDLCLRPQIKRPRNEGFRFGA